MKRRLLVTGASGMVGGLVTKRAVEEGYWVRAMVRKTSDIRHLDSPSIEIFHAELTDPESLPGALKGIDQVVHTAAHLGDWGDAEQFRAINVYALEHLLNAARHESQLQRWVQVSSLGVYPAVHHYGTNEDAPTDLAGLDGYTTTKAEAETLLRRYIDDFDFPATIIRPGFIYGPGDRHVVPRIVEKIAAGKMKVIGDGKKLLNNTYAGNLVDAIMLALKTDGIEGEIFNIRDQQLVSREEFIGTIADFMGKPRPGKIPEWIARVAVKPIEGFAKIRGAKTAPLLTQARIKFLTLNLDFSIEKAKQQLGYDPKVGFQEGMRKALEWAENENLLDRKNVAK